MCIRDRGGRYDSNDSEFLHLLVESIEDFEDRAESGIKRSSEECTKAADGDGFGGCVYWLACEVVAEDFDGDAEMCIRDRQYALLHQAGRVADARDVANVSLKGESVQVCAAKYDAGAGRRWGELQARTYRGVESDAFSFYSASNGVLECHRKD